MGRCEGQRLGSREARRHGHGPAAAEAQRLAADVEEAGFSGLWFTEGGRTADLGAAAAALATTELDIGTGIAVAFPRSPMVTAQNAWELAEATGGRFVLGLGTQVKAHIERRYCSPFEHPGPRLREYVLALRAIFRAFRGEEKLDFHGDFYTSRCSRMWSPGPIEHPDLPIYVAGGAPVDVPHGRRGRRRHPRAPAALAALPRRGGAAQRAKGPRGRARPAEVLVCPCSRSSATPTRRGTRWRERARVPARVLRLDPHLREVFELHGWTATSERLHELQKAGDLAGMAAKITDEMLDVYAVKSTWDDLADSDRRPLPGAPTASSATSPPTPCARTRPSTSGRPSPRRSRRPARPRGRGAQPSARSPCHCGSRFSIQAVTPSVASGLPMSARWTARSQALTSSSSAPVSARAAPCSPPPSGARCWWRCPAPPRAPGRGRRRPRAALPGRCPSRPRRRQRTCGRSAAGRWPGRGRRGRGSVQCERRSGLMPRRFWTMPSLASARTYRRSHCRAIVRPMPTAWPLIRGDDRLADVPGVET